MEPKIAIFTSHDASMCVLDSDGSYRMFEFERLTKERFVNLNKKDNFKEVYNELFSIVKKECQSSSFKTCFCLSLPPEHKEHLAKLFGIEKFVEVYHHSSHAACSLYQSPFDEALIISYDGGGFDGGKSRERVAFFNIYHGTKQRGVRKVAYIPYDLGTAYGLVGLPISEIPKSQENWGDRFLSFAGKIMGLVAYGNVREEWVEGFEKFYKVTSRDLEAPDVYKYLNNELPGLDLNLNAASGQMSYDLAATSQFVFEKIIWEEINKYISDIPVCVSGGCALNVIFNQKLKDELKVPLFVPPNPSDCGLPFGMIMQYEKPQHQIDLTYSGFPILDKDKLSEYVQKYNGRKFEISELATLLRSGKIIGLMRGNSEHGPRALGNRSILCDPSFAHMKDTLNAKVKYREWFRPFAPMVCSESVEKYFHFTGDARFMSYSPKVKEEWKEKLPAIVHNDGTARVQTVSTEQNGYIYNLLKEFEKLSGFDVLLNTSFNIKGKPILTTIEDAIDVLKSTEIDGVVVEDYLFLK